MGANCCADKTNNSTRNVQQQMIDNAVQNQMAPIDTPQAETNSDNIANTKQNQKLVINYASKDITSNIKIRYHFGTKCHDFWEDGKHEFFDPENMLNDTDFYWEGSRNNIDNKDPYIVFDTLNYNITQIEITFEKKADDSDKTKCKRIEITTGDSLFDIKNFKTIQNHTCIIRGRAVFNQIKLNGYDQKNSRYICIIFKELSELYTEMYCVRVNQCKFMGHEDRANETKLKDEFFEWELIQPQNTDDFEEEEDAVDVTYDEGIKFIDSFPAVRDGWQLEKAYSHSDSSSFLTDDYTDKYGEKYIILEFNNVKIDCFMVQFSQLEEPKMVLIYTCDDYDSENKSNDDWKLIQRNDIPWPKELTLSGHKYMIYLKSKHSRFVKMGFRINRSDTITIEFLKWKGYVQEIRDKDDITNNICVHQTSPNTTSAHPLTNVLSTKKNETLRFKNHRDNPDNKSWLILDCKNYHIQHFVIRFAGKTKPAKIKLKLSNIPNAYNFYEQKSLYGMNLDVANSWDDGDWDKINSTEDINDIQDLYKKSNGFKRYLCIEFCNSIASAIMVTQIMVYGYKLSEDVFKVYPEQFNRFLDNEVTIDDAKYEESNIDEQKYESNEPYMPIIISHSLTHSTSSIDNIWDPSDETYWVANTKMDTFLIIDVGNNNIDKIIVSTTRATVPFKDCSVLTSNRTKTKDKDWVLIEEHKEDVYDLIEFNIKDKHDKYVKLMFGSKITARINHMYFYGDSIYFDNHVFSKKLTWDDVNNLGPFIDENVVIKFEKEEMDRLDKYEKELKASIKEYSKYKSKLDKINAPNDEYFEAQRKIMAVQDDKMLVTSKLSAKLKATTHEEKELLQIAEEKYKVGLEFNEQLIEFDKEKEKIQKAREEDKSIQWDGKEYYNKLSQIKKDKQNKLSSMYSIGDNEENTPLKAYNAWKESIMKHPRTLSNLYNVNEYSQTTKYGKEFDNDGMVECWKILADTFEKCLDEKKELLHKYHVFQLSEVNNFFVAREQNKRILPHICVDCNNRIIKRIEFKFHDYEIKIKDVIITTSDHLYKDIKNIESTRCYDDDEYVIDEESFYEITNKKVVATNIEPNTGYYAWDSNYSYTTVIVDINEAHKKYLNLIINTRNTPDIDHISFFVQKHEEDSIENGESIPKYQLEMYWETDAYLTRYNSIAQAYNLSNKDTFYECAVEYGGTTSWIMFDCNNRQINKFDIGFTGNEQYFGKFSVLTTLTKPKRYETNGQDPTRGWKVLYDSSISKNEYNNQYLNTIISVELGCKNLAYIALRWEGIAEFKRRDKTKARSVRVNYLKFYCNDSDESKWDIDNGIVNKTNEMKIVPEYSSRISGYEEWENVLFYNNQRIELITVGVINEHEIISRQIRDIVCSALNKLMPSNGGKLNVHEKHFCKYLLCWQNPQNYDELFNTASRIMNILRMPLDIEYNRLQSINSEILTLSLDTKYKLPENVKSNRELLYDTYKHWYEPRKPLFYPSDLSKLKDEWQKLGLNVTDPEFIQIRQNGRIDSNISFASAENVAIDYLNYIAAALDSSFQSSMKTLFKENRVNLNLSNIGEDDIKRNEIGVLSGPIKTKARQNVKIKLDYYDREPPQCMSILDIVRCAIICEDDIELCSLFKLICNKYMGKILRVKNGFDDAKKGTYGYRAILINLAYSDATILPKEYEMIVEIQLLLYKYYKVRQNMHLGYGIVRAKTEDNDKSGNAQETSPYYVLAKDSCKFGKIEL